MPRRPIIFSYTNAWSMSFTRLVLSHMAFMSSCTQSQVGMAMCTSGFAGSLRDSVNEVDHRVIGSRQHAQYDSRRHSVPWNWGMFDTATASWAQPMKLWNVSPMYISTWLGNAENGGAFKMSQFGES